LAGLGVDVGVLPVTGVDSAEVFLAVIVIDPRLAGASRSGFGETFVGCAEGDVDQIGRIADVYAPEPNFILGISVEGRERRRFFLNAARDRTATAKKQSETGQGEDTVHFEHIKKRSI
jgi:hypothetical protein